MAGFVVFAVVFTIVAVGGYLIITRFRLGETALMIFGLLLLLALVLYLFTGVIPGGPVWRIP